MVSEEDEERTFCYVEGTPADKNATDEPRELQENVWFNMKPPKGSRSIYHPYVSARQIDLVRALLTGKNSFKSVTKMKLEPYPDTKPLPRKAPSREKLSLNKKKSSVKFLSDVIYKQL